MVNEYDVRIDEPEMFYGNKKKKRNYFVEIGIGILIIMVIILLIAKF